MAGCAYSYAQLRALVARCARGLRAAGIGPGDRVAGYVANVPEAVIACLACASLGAIWSSASPDFGLAALCDRFTQVEPKLVFATTHYRYNGRLFRTDEVVKALHEHLPSVQTVVSIPYPVDEAHRHGDMTWQDFLGPDDAPELSLRRYPSNILSIFCFHPELRVLPNASCMAPAVRSCNIARSRSCTRTSGLAIHCYISRRAAG